MDYYVIGLGNPGTKYELTRHNVGMMVLQELIPSGWDFDKYLNAQYQSGTIASHTVHYLLPQTFMNKSGESVAGLSKIFSSFGPERLVVVYDDLDLPLGTVRISFDRGSGGHNGIKSIAQHLGSQKFIRIRIGIAKTLDGGKIVKPPVLGRFEKQELSVVHSDITSKVKMILESIVEEGHEKAMNQYNR